MEKPSEHEVAVNHVEIAIAVLNTFIASIERDVIKGLYNEDQIEEATNLKETTEKIIRILSVACEMYKEDNLGKE
jgi:3-phosphoglycerate kinase